MVLGFSTLETFFIVYLLACVETLNKRLTYLNVESTLQKASDFS